MYGKLKLFRKLKNKSDTFLETAKTWIIITIINNNNNNNIGGKNGGITAFSRKRSCLTLPVWLAFVLVSKQSWHIFSLHEYRVEFNYTYYPAENYMLKVNDRNTKTRCEICSKLTIKTPEQCHWRPHRVIFTDLIQWLLTNVLEFSYQEL